MNIIIGYNIYYNKNIDNSPEWKIEVKLFRNLFLFLCFLYKFK